MRLLLVAPRAELLPLRPLGMLPPVLGREIVPTLTDGTLHDDVLSWHLNVLSYHYFKIFVTTPAPTVRPPSRMANRSCSSIAIGVISSIVIFVLSPGITISTPAGNSTEPVTSVVRK